MFGGGAYGVGVTVNSVEPMPWDDASGADVPLPPGVEVHPTRLGELMPVGARTQAERATELERIGVVEGQLAAYKAEIIAAMARDSSTGDGSAGDRRSGRAGAASPDWAPDQGDEPLPDVSEFFPDELALIMRCSRAAAITAAEVSVTLVERLPAAWVALADGRLDWPRARALALELGWPARDTEPGVIGEVIAAVLPSAMELSVKRLRALVARELISRDAAAAERRRKQSERTADVTIHGLGNGMSELRAIMPAQLAASTRDAVDSYARMAKADGAPGTLGQLRVGVLADLVLRPWDSSRPPVTAELTVIAPLDALRPPYLAPFMPPSDTSTADPPVSAGRAVVADHAPRGSRAAPVGEVSGQPITSAHLRELLHQLDALCPGGLQAPVDGSLIIGLVEPGSGELRATVTRSELERLVRRGCPDHPTGACECPVLDRPAAVDRYRPTPAHYRFARTRDRTCRHPGCDNRAAWADLDHVIPHGRGGPTDCANLCCLCRRHHRLKTHAEGWRFDLRPDGLLSVTRPTGVTRATRPPGMSPPNDPDPPVTPRANDDPPPF